MGRLYLIKIKMLSDFFKISVNNLRRRKLRSWLTMIGIFIGIAAVVALISLGQGLQTAITGQLGSLDADSLTIQNSGSGFGPPGSTVVEKLNDHDLKLIERVKGVKSAEGILLRTVEMEFNQVVSYNMMQSVPEDKEKYEKFYKAQSIKAEEGRLLISEDYRKVVLGNNFADKTKFNKKISIGKTILIEGEEFEVIGILEASGSIFTNAAVLVFHDEMKEVLEIGDEIDLIGVTIVSPEIVEETAERIEKAIRKDRGLKEGEEDFSVQTPSQVLGTVTNILTAVNLVVIGIAMISLIVGGIGIANTMYTSVLERKKEIGTMKAIGARNSNILTMFLIESGLLGLVGGVVGALIGSGTALGIAAGANNFFGSNIIEISVSIPLLVSVITFSFLIGVLSGAVPSYQASKLKPAEALRG
ncbi:MAG TPA: ABC transporter permease [Candidatus Nanoarchaeia archaeon]|nr:ABC transporter permease [Candidatus Nanoarchaeia archaeon]